MRQLIILFGGGVDFRLVYKGIGLLLSFTEFFIKSPFQRDIGSLWRHSDITRHFLMECRAEVGAIEGKYANLLRFPKKRSGLPWHDKQFRIRCSLDRKPMRHIPVLLHVSHVEVHLVAG